MTDMLLDTALSSEQRRQALNVKDNAASLLTILNFSKPSSGRGKVGTAQGGMRARQPRVGGRAYPAGSRGPLTGDN
jgi:hypothetical protein